MSGGLSLFRGKVYDVSQEERDFASAEDWVQVYPNPSEGSLQLNWNKESVGPLRSLDIYNYSGQKVGSFSGEELENRINLNPNLKEGVYLLVIQGDRRQTVKKLILNRQR